MNFDSFYFKSHHIGPVISYNFLENHMKSVNDILPSINKNDDYLTLVVGEVDCRLHIPLQADKQNRTDDIIVEECVGRLFRCYDILIECGYNVFCLGTHPTTTECHDMSSDDRPIYGDVVRRNNICVLWESYLKIESDKRGIKFISIYRYLVDKNNITKMEYFQDYCHLIGSEVYPFIVKELQIKNII